MILRVFILSYTVTVAVGSFGGGEAFLEHTCMLCEGDESALHKCKHSSRKPLNQKHLGDAGIICSSGKQFVFRNV